MYQVKENTEDEWQLFYDQIEGFEWEPGYTYELIVAVDEIENPPADASSLRYVLIEVVNKVETPVEPENPSLYPHRSPRAEAALDASQPILISGMGAGLFEGNVIVQILDADGNELALQPTTLQSPDAGIGGEGPWEIEISLVIEVLTQGKIVAFSPSPQDGEGWLASDEINVSLNPEMALELTENTPWMLRPLPNMKISTPCWVFFRSPLFDSLRIKLTGIAGCNNYFTSYK